MCAYSQSHTARLLSGLLQCITVNMSGYTKVVTQKYSTKNQCIGSKRLLQKFVKWCCMKRRGKRCDKTVTYLTLEQEEHYLKMFSAGSKNVRQKFKVESVADYT